MAIATIIGIMFVTANLAVAEMSGNRVTILQSDCLGMAIAKLYSSAEKSQARNPSKQVQVTKSIAALLDSIDHVLERLLYFLIFLDLICSFERSSSLVFQDREKQPCRFRSNGRLGMRQSFDEFRYRRFADFHKSAKDRSDMDGQNNPVLSGAIQVLDQYIHCLCCPECP